MSSRRTTRSTGNPPPGASAPDFERLFAAVPAMCLVLEPDTPRFTILAATDAYLEATLTEEAAIVGRGLFEVFPDNPADPHATGTRNLGDSLDRVIAHRRTDTMAVQRYDIRRPDDPDGAFEERFWSPVNFPVFDEDGNLSCILHRVDDVTEFVLMQRAGDEQRLALEQLRSRAGEMEIEIYRRAQEVQEMNRQLRAVNERLGRLDELKTQFLANASHELRTPLALITGPIEEMLTSPDLPRGWARGLLVMASNARTLTRRVNDMLEIARLDAGQVRIGYAEVNLAELLRHVTQLFDSVAREQDVQLQVDVADGLRAQLDPAKLERVLINLLSNAFKFAPQGGRIRCRAAPAPGDDGIVLEVADSGPGIPASERAAVFERFRAAGDPGNRFGSTGLGLAIARELVALHGGSIAVTDAPEGGALFVVNLPRRAPAGAHWHSQPAGEASRVAAAHVVEELRARRTAPRPYVPDALWAYPGRVLVVEDNAELNRYICEQLGNDYHVIPAFSGVEGLARARAEVPDLVLADVMMPDMSGDELLRALRADGRFDAVPVVMMTARADEGFRLELLEQGAQDYLLKPFSTKELRLRIGNLLAARRAGDRRASAGSA